MINQRRAFNRHTTTKAYLEVWQPGRYDERNRYVDESYSPSTPIAVTPIPFGDRDEGIAGKQLKATEIGERQPAFMQFHSRTEMPMKSIITIYGVRYKVVQINEYAAAGFHKVVATRVLDN
ncbi:hypothetical protein ACEV6Q_04230 [Enterobacter ludwigii]|uniref:hypothetical protein n=1 Tax=Enterobacter ludwigii TaxID=299767 RepID=UPI003BEEB089